MQRKTGQSYLFKMVSRTSNSSRITLLAFAIMFVCIDTIKTTANEDFQLSTPKLAVQTEPSTILSNISLTNEHIEGLKNKTHKPAITTMISTGNDLWDGIIRDCLRQPSFSCFQKNVHNYLDNTLDLGDVNVTNSFMFLKNKVDVHKYTREANNDHFVEGENKIPDEEAARSGKTCCLKIFTFLFIILIKCFTCNK